MVNHLLYDTVSLQIVALVFVAFAAAEWVDGGVGRVVYPSPRRIVGLSAALTVALCLLIGGSAKYYGAPWLILGKVMLWAGHVGLLAAGRQVIDRRVRSYRVSVCLVYLAIFEAVASLAVVFLR